MTTEKVMREFNRLGAGDEKLEVCAAIYFEMYGENIKDVMEHRTVTDLKNQIRRLAGKTDRLISAIRQKDEYILSLKETLKETRQELSEMRKSRLTSMQTRTLWNHLPEEMQKEFKREFRENVVCQDLRRAIETKSERIRLLERIIDEELTP